MKRLKMLEQEGARQKKLRAEAAPDIEVLEKINAKQRPARSVVDSGGCRDDSVIRRRGGPPAICDEPASRGAKWRDR